jgi:hypothetical protein
LHVSIPSRRSARAKNSIIEAASLALAHTNDIYAYYFGPESSFRWHPVLPNSCNRPIDAHDLILAIISLTIHLITCTPSPLGCASERLNRCFFDIVSPSRLLLNTAGEIEYSFSRETSAEARHEKCQGLSPFAISVIANFLLLYYG